MGQDLERALYGPKDVMGHTWAGSYNGLESYWTAQMQWAGPLPFDQVKRADLFTGMGLCWAMPRVDVS